MTPDQLVAKFKILRQFRFSQAHFREFAQIAAEERKKGFDRAEGPDGEKWQALTDKTIERKRRRGASKPSAPLIEKGYLRTPTVSATSREGRVVLAKSRSAGVWSGKSISEIHDEGNDRIPRRRHWAIYLNAEKRIRERAEYLFEQEVKKVF